MTKKCYAKEKNKSSIETIKRRVYVHIFLSNECNHIESEKFKYTIFGLKGCIEFDEDLTKTQEEFIEKYFNIKKTKSGIVVTINNDEYAKTKERKGIFVIISNRIKDAKMALDYYTRHKSIEDLYRVVNDKTDKNKQIMWTIEECKGFIYVQFISICYYSWLYKKLEYMKNTLGKENGDPRHDLKLNIEKEKELLKWINERSLHRILLHFDSYQTVQARQGGRLKSWTGAMTDLDRLFIEKLRAKPEEQADAGELAEPEGEPAS